MFLVFSFYCFLFVLICNHSILSFYNKLTLSLWNDIKSDFKIPHKNLEERYVLWFDSSVAEEGELKSLVVNPLSSVECPKVFALYIEILFNQMYKYLQSSL